MQVTFSFGFVIAWDKCPNKFGAKNVVQDAMGIECHEDEEWRDNLASVGLHLLSLAVHQGIIKVSDLQSLEIGVPFKLSHLIRRRPQHQRTISDKEIDLMYVTVTPTSRALLCIGGFALSL